MYADPSAWSAVLAGGGIKGGQVVGRSSARGAAVEEGLKAIKEVVG